MKGDLDGEQRTITENVSDLRQITVSQHRCTQVFFPRNSNADRMDAAQMWSVLFLSGIAAMEGSDCFWARLIWAAGA